MKTKQIIKTMAVFFIGNALSKLISFFLLPLYTNKIDPVQYGNYDLAFSFINLLAPLAFFQIWDGMYRIAFDYKDNEDKKVIISNALGFSVIGIVLYLILFFIINCFFEIFYFEYVLIYGLIYGISYLYSSSTRVYLSNKLFVFSGLISTLTTAIVNIVLISGFHWDVKSIYLSATIGLLVQILIIEFRVGVIRHFKLSHIKANLLRQMVKFSIPLCIATISYWLLSGFTKVIIQYFGGGDYANGIYAVANKFSVFITFVVNVIQFAWNETAYLISIEEQAERQKNYESSINIMVIGILFGTAFFCLASKVMFPFMVDSQYYEAIYIVPITIIGTSLNSLASFTGTFFMAEKKTTSIWTTTLIASLVNVVGGYFCTKFFGLLGGVLTLSISFTFLALIRIIIATKMLKIKIKFGKIIIPIITLMFSIISYYLITSILITLFLLLGIIVVFAILFRKHISKIFKLLGKRDI